MLTFRLATHQDVEAAVALINSAYRGDSSRAGWTTEADILGGQRTDPDTLRSLLDAPGQRLLLAEDEGRLVGAVHLADEDDGSLYFGMLTVRPDTQASGVGKALLAEIGQVAHRQGAWRIRMTVIHLRTELMAYYERRGFARTGRVVPFPMHDPKYGEPKVPHIELIEMAKLLR